MKRSLPSLALLTILLTAPLAAGASSPNKIAPDLGENEATSVTTSLKCTVVDVLPGNRVVLRDIKSGYENEVFVAPEIQLRTRAKKQFDGRRELSFSDLQAGQMVKVTIQNETGVITRIDVLKKKA